MIPRFNLGDHGDKRLLDRATELKITLFRDGDEVVGGFELHGHLGSDDEELFGGTASASDLTFLRELLERFQSKREDGAL